MLSLHSWFSHMVQYVFCKTDGVKKSQNKDCAIKWLTSVMDGADLDAADNLYAESTTAAVVNKPLSNYNQFTTPHNSA